MTLGIGLIGTGFMGKAHALAWRNARAVLGTVPDVRLELLCDTPADKAASFASQFGFARSTDDWKALVTDPKVDIVSITTPNRFHKEMALAALAAGKHVWCEKPMGLTLADGEEMAAAAAASGKTTMVGYNYIRNPAFRHAQKLVEAGRIGRLVHVRGIVDEDYQADPDLAWTWRARLEEAGLGTLGDLGCHLVSMLMGLCGPIESLVADMQTVHTTRPLPDGSGRGAGGERGHRNGPPALCQRRARLPVHLALRLGPQEPSWLRATWHEGHAGLRSGAHERAAALCERGTEGRAGLPHHPVWPRARRLWRVLPRSRPSGRLQ
jgi:predicted dehydrogenase